MFTRQSRSIEIAEYVMVVSAARGHTELECGYRTNVERFLLETADVDTLGGWMTVAEDRDHLLSYHIMAFIWCHPYLRDLFPADVQYEFARMGLKFDHSRQMMSFVARGKGLLPVELEDQLPYVQYEYLSYFTGSEHWLEVRDG